MMISTGFVTSLLGGRWVRPSEEVASGRLPVLLSLNFWPQWERKFKLLFLIFLV